VTESNVQNRKATAAFEVAKCTLSLVLFWVQRVEKERLNRDSLRGLRHCVLERRKMGLEGQGFFCIYMLPRMSRIVDEEETQAET
jgi:hypothetical protein